MQCTAVYSSLLQLSAVQYSSVHYKLHISGGSCSQGVLFIKKSGLVCTGDKYQQCNVQQCTAVYFISVQCSIIQLCSAVYFSLVHPGSVPPSQNCGQGLVGTVDFSSDGEEIPKLLPTKRGRRKKVIFLSSFFTESALRPIQSISRDVRLFVCLCVCVSVTP